MGMEAIEVDLDAEIVAILEGEPRILVHLRVGGEVEEVESCLLSQAMEMIRAQAQSQMTMILRVLLVELRDGKLRYLMVR